MNVQQGVDGYRWRAAACAGRATVRSGTVALLVGLSGFLLAAGWARGAPGAAPAPAGRTLLEAVEALWRGGQITREQYHRYRVAGVRHPDRLPAGLRGLPLGVGAGARGGGISATQVLVEAFQFLVRRGGQGSELHALLQPPADDTYVIRSATHPLQISFPEASQQTYAASVLAAAEYAWDVEVGQWGFYPPAMQPGYEPYRIFLGETGQGVAGYTSPYETNDTVPWASCYTYIVINPYLGESAATTMAHEFNHALQATMDCAEVTTYWENTATYIEAYVYPEYEVYQWAMMQYFQALPWRALDYFDQGGGYQYGGVLWNYYLAHRMAPAGDGPVMVREIWEASMQTGWQNEPDYYDAIEQVADARGLDATSMAALYEDFAEARYFVSSRDDGQHIERAGEFWRAELTPVARYDALLLPVRDAAPPADREPAPMGSNHIVVSVPDGWHLPIRVRLSFDAGTRWAARVVVAAEGQPTESTRIAIDPDRRTGETTVTPPPGATLLVVVANLGEADYDPDSARGWPTSGYRYTLEPVVPPPVIDAIYPGAVARGQQNLRVRIVGSGFVYGDDFAVSFTDPSIQVGAIERVTDGEVILSLTVPAATNLGLHAVTVVNQGGASATREHLFAVVDRVGPPDPLPRDGGCQQTGTGPGGAVPLLLWAVWAAIRRRRAELGSA